jgi:hypothetical protein
MAININGRLEFFVLGMDWNVYHIAQQTPGGYWGDWEIWEAT